ncbi:MAG TPA: VWA domain-containing protein [Hyphomicrobiaceae bacterium]|nr:VWA domain-containing protein [Hyphomicrobiaceae bacterium]
MRLQRTLAALWGDRSGGVAILFAMFAVILIGFIGFAIDYTRSTRVAIDAQASLDAAALAAARAKSMNDGDPKVVADQYFNVNFVAKHDTLSYALATVVDESERQINVTATAKMRTYFARLFGFNDFQLNLNAISTYGVTTSELVLVLDNTGSMAGAKLEALKTAASGLVDTIYSVPNADTSVRIGIVPFAQYINVGMEYRSAPWIDVPMDTSTTTYKCWNTYPNATSSNCHTVTNSCLKDGMPSTCTSTQCDWNYGDPVEKCGDVTSTQKWHGCVGSRSYPLDVQTGADFSTRVPGLMNISCNSQLTRLTNSRTDLVSKIEAMSATHDTFIQPGIIWGWRVLDWNQPFADGVDPGSTQVRKFMVVMTDGINTKSPTYPTHNGGSTVSANSLTKEVCQNVKAKGVVVYTVAFEVTEPSVVDVLKTCASGPDNYYQAADATSLSDSFKKIAESISVVRIAR